jgi:hypothetical protein
MCRPLFEQPLDEFQCAFDHAGSAGGQHARDLFDQIVWRLCTTRNAPHRFKPVVQAPDCLTGDTRVGADQAAPEPGGRSLHEPRFSSR